MLYDGVLRYDYNTIVTETECYVDPARHLVILKSEEAVGLVETNNVVIIYDLMDNKPILITERCSSDEITEEDIFERIKGFNEMNSDYIGTITCHDGWFDVIVTRQQIYETINDTM